MIKLWWLKIKDIVVQDRKVELEKQKRQKTQKIPKVIITDPAKIFELPVDTIFNFLIVRHIVKDRHQAQKLVHQQLGHTKNQDKMSFGEFNKLFCKSMFKQALIKTLDSLLKE